MNNGARRRGDLGEKIACAFLMNKGYEIVERNFTIRGGEIDIVAWKDAAIVFVEVKTRRSKKFGLGNESLTYEKKRRLRLAVYAFLHRKRLAISGFRFDLIDIELDCFDRSKNVEHFEDLELY